MRFGISLAFTLAAFSAAHANDDALIRHQYDEQAAAVNTDNEKRLFATIDPSFTQIDPQKTQLDYAQYKQGLASLFANVKSGTMKFKLGPIHFANGTAIVDYRLEGDLVTRRGPKSHDVEIGVDTWKKVGKTYLQVHEVIKSSKFTPIGKGASVSA